MVGLLAIVSVVAFIQQGMQGLAVGMIGSIDLMQRAAPALALGFVLAGLLTVLFPPKTVGRWMGDEAGLKGIMIGAAAGALSPGGPYVMYPIAAALIHGGAGIGSIAAFTVSRNMFTANRFLVYELPFLGVPLAVARTIATFWLIFVGTALVPMVFRIMPRSARESARGPIRAQREESSK